MADAGLLPERLDRDKPIRPLGQPVPIGSWIGAQQWIGKAREWIS